MTNNEQWKTYEQAMVYGMQYHPYYNWNHVQPPQQKIYERPSKKTRMNPSKAKWIWKAKKSRRPYLNPFRNIARRQKLATTTLLDAWHRLEAEEKDKQLDQDLINNLPKLPEGDSEVGAGYSTGNGNQTDSII